MMLLLLLQFLLLPVNTQAQIADLSIHTQVRLDASPYLSDWEIQRDMAWVEISGFTEVPVSAFLQVTMTGERSGEVARGRSVSFNLPAGEIFRRIDSPDMVDWGSVRYAGELRSRTLRTGRIPGDAYELCVLLLDSVSSAEYSRDCTTFTILIPEPPNLIMPVGEELVEDPYPVFEWTPVFWLPGRPVTYHIRIVQVMERQMPQDALRANIPLLEHQVTDVTHVTYPVGSLPLETGAVYVWQVQATDADGVPVGENRGLSDIGLFEYRSLLHHEREVDERTRVRAVTDPERIVHCVIENHSFLLRTDVCRSLAGTPWQGDLALPLEQIRDEDPAPFTITVQDSPHRIPDHGKLELDVRYHAYAAEVPEVLVALSWFLGDSTQTTQVKFEPGTPAVDGDVVSLDYTGLPEGVYGILLRVADSGNTPAEDILYASHEYRDQPLHTGEPEFDALLDEELAVFVSTPVIDISLSWDRADAISRRIRGYSDRIRDVNDRIREKTDDYFEKIELAEWLEQQNRIIDRIPRVYEGRIRILQDSLNTLRGKQKVPDEDEMDALRKGIDRAAEARDACQDRISDLENRISELEGEADDLKDKMMELMEEHHQLMLRHGFEGRYRFNDTDNQGGYGEGSGYSYGYIGSGGGVPRNSPDYQRMNDLQMELRSLRREWRRKKRSIDHLKDELDRAREECIRRADDVAEAEKLLEDAEEAIRNQEAMAALADAVALELKTVCDEMAEMLKKLAEWCRDYPDTCPFTAEIETILEKCPPEDGNWDSFFESLRRIKSTKKALEERLHREAARLVNDIENLENERARLAREQAELREREREEWRRQQELRAQRERERAAAKAAADERERRNRRIRDLADKAREGSDEALKDLAILIGLEALDKMGDAGKNIAAIINGLLAAKELPECACKIFQAFILLLAPGNTDAEIAVYADALINAWRECANLPAIASVMPGSQELGRMVSRIPKEERTNMVNAMRAALPPRCR